MKRVSALLFLPLFASHLYAGANKEEIIRKADEAWAVRDSPGKAKESLEMLKEAISSNPEDFDLLWRYARINFWIADSSNDKKIKARYGKEGYMAGKKATAVRPERVEGYFWGAATLGMYSEGIGILRSIKEGNKGKFEDMLNKALKIDRTYEGGGPIRTRGRYFARLPWPMKDVKKGIDLLDECIALNKKVIRALYYKAEILFEEGDYKQVKGIIERIRKDEFPGDDEPEKRLIRRWAEDLSKKVDKRLK